MVQRIKYEIFIISQEHFNGISYWISLRNDAMGKGTQDIYSVKDGSSRERRGRSRVGGTTLGG